MAPNQVIRRRAKASRVPPAVPRRDKPISDLSRCLEEAKAAPDLRWERIQAVRRALAEGKYDVEGRLDELFLHWPEELQALEGER